MRDIADGNLIFRRVYHPFRALGAERAAKFDTSDPVEAELPRGGTRLVYIRNADDLRGAVAYLCPASLRVEILGKRNANFICFFLRLFRRASLLFD